MIAGFAVFSAVLLVIALGLIVKSRRRATVTGIEHLLGQRAVVESMGAEGAYVRLDGELWHVECAQPLAPEDKVTVDAVDGLVLKVSKSGD
jgi:membrane-bound serine protease (ClpP class)